MSVIVHRCTVCSHPDIFKRGAVCCYDQCPTGRHTPQFTESEVIPTWDGLGKPIEVVAEPGGQWNNVDLCGCDSCRALYESLAGAA